MDAWSQPNDRWPFFHRQARPERYAARPGIATKHQGTLRLHLRHGNLLRLPVTHRRWTDRNEQTH